MTNLVPKLTLYDFLASLLPGYLLLVLLKLLPPVAELSKIIGLHVSSDVGKAVIYFTMSYTLGLIIKGIGALIFNHRLYNRPKDLTEALRSILREDKDAKIIRDLYYTAYYRVLQNYPATVVPILETQVAFVRSIILVLLCSMFILPFSSSINTSITDEQVLSATEVTTVTDSISVKVAKETIEKIKPVSVALILMLLSIPFFYIKRRWTQKNLWRITSWLPAKFWLISLLCFSCTLFLKHMENIILFLEGSISFLVSVLLILLFSTQRTIYERVWEDDHYLRKLESEASSKSN